MPDVGYLSDSDESFHSFNDDEPAPPAPARPLAQNHDREAQPSASNGDDHEASKPKIDRFSPQEEAALVAESNTMKGAGNQLFGKGSFGEAIQTYDQALASCPNYLEYELAVLRSNIAACHLKLEQWKESAESATKGIDCLERLEPLPKPKTKTEKAAGEEEDDAIQEVDDGVADRIENLQKSGRTLDEVRKLQVKLLMRRAKAKTETGGWAALQAAEEDYKILLTPVMLPTLSATDKKTVLDAAQKLGPRLNAAKEQEVAEMMDKLKGLGNSILKPFGLSTQNFQFTKDEKTGGYSMNFNQNPDKEG